VTSFARTFQETPDPDVALVAVLETAERALVTLAGAALEEEGIDHAIEQRGLADQILGQRWPPAVGETGEPFALLVRETDAGRAKQVIDALANQPPLPAADAESAASPQAVPLQGSSNESGVALFDAATGVHVGTLSDAQFSQIEANLERESAGDDDYYLTPETVDLLSERGAGPEVVAVLRHALGGRPGMDLRWVRA
jgi:hypothetical protein